MTIIVKDADTACQEIDVQDMSDYESLDKLKCLIQMFQYQTEYWQCYKRYAPSLEALIEDIDPHAYKFMRDTLTRAKKYFREQGTYPDNIEDLKGWEEIN